MPIGAEKPLSALKQIEVIFMGYILTCDDGEFYFDDIDQAIEYGEQNCPRGYNIDEVHN